jgi:hypothetical protein
MIGIHGYPRAIRGVAEVFRKFRKWNRFDEEDSAVTGPKSRTMGPLGVNAFVCGGYGPETPVGWVTRRYNRYPRAGGVACLGRNAGVGGRIDEQPPVSGRAAAGPIHPISGGHSPGSIAPIKNPVGNDYRPFNSPPIHPMISSIWAVINSGLCRPPGMIFVPGKTAAPCLASRGTMTGICASRLKSSFDPTMM